MSQHQAVKFGAPSSALGLLIRISPWQIKRRPSIVVAAIGSPRSFVAHQLLRTASVFVTGP